MSGELSLFNRQRVRPVDVRLLRAFLAALLERVAGVADHDLAVHLVNAGEMTALNEGTLHHAGSTDVITFDFAEQPAGPLTGEIYVCVEEAVIQAARFRTTWQAELARYLIHGLLHLRGHTDSRRAARQKMKREEDRLLREMGRRFDLSRLGRKTKLFV